MNISIVYSEDGGYNVRLPKVRLSPADDIPPAIRKLIDPPEKGENGRLRWRGIDYNLRLRDGLGEAEGADYAVEVVTEAAADCPCYRVDLVWADPESALAQQFDGNSNVLCGLTSVELATKAHAASVAALKDHIAAYQAARFAAFAKGLP